jgi:glyoxylase-like metal-dependent hydrolase (beta-lactamase superfamily II)
MCAKRWLNPRRPLARLVATVLAQQDREDGGHRYQDFKASYRPFTIVADKTFDQEEVLKIGDLKFNVISTPGHSEGSACYELFDKLVFTGDTLLQNDPIILRFPGGNKDDYKNVSLPYLRSLPKDTIIMPGHGDPFILKDTKNI